MTFRKQGFRVGLCSLGLLFLAIGLVSAKGVSDTTKPLTEEDKRAIQTVIQKQIEAFQQDDGKTAFSLVSPSIQKRFRTPDVFLGIVQNAYRPIYRPQRVEFLNVEMVNNIPIQMLHVTGPDGGVYQVFYLMELQQDQTWKTNGCYLVQTQNTAI